MIKRLVNYGLVLVAAICQLAALIVIFLAQIVFISTPLRLQIEFEESAFGYVGRRLLLCILSATLISLVIVAVYYLLKKITNARVFQLGILTVFKWEWIILCTVALAGLLTHLIYLMKGGL